MRSSAGPASTHSPSPCCLPARADRQAPADRQGRVDRQAGAGQGTGGDRPAADRSVVAGASPVAPPGLVALAGGVFQMGNDDAAAIDGDGEGPSRRVTLSPFSIAATAVTNAAFSAFVRATRYQTVAERVGSSFVFYRQLGEAARRGRRPPVPDLPWWLDVEGACWQRPEGPGSDIVERPDHPVVHIAWEDARAYCAWSGTRLPTEAEWEFAARGGLAGRRYPWGDEPEPDGQRRCQTWQGIFPNRPAAGWQPGTVPVTAYAPNGFGLYNVVGNVWEWCSDWFDPDYHRLTGRVDPRQDRPSGRRSLRGGSFLCEASYCFRYRVAARSSAAPDSTTSHCGFRLASGPSGGATGHAGIAVDD